MFPLAAGETQRRPFVTFDLWNGIEPQTLLIFKRFAHR